jgi:hypothetical protein
MRWRSYLKSRRDYITVTWHSDDVAEIRPDLDRQHHASVGISRDVVEYTAGSLYPE